MQKKQKGNPIMTLRLQTWQLNGLHFVANRENTTASDIVRRLVTDYLRDNGITGGGVKPVDGQVTLDV